MIILVTAISLLAPLNVAQDLKLSGWVSCGDWACSVPIQEGIARLNFIGVKTSEDIDWLTVRSGETLVVTGKDAGTFKGQQLLCGYIKGKEEEKGFGIFPNSVIRVLRDKMNNLGARRYWTDLQEEKRNPKVDDGTEGEHTNQEKSADPPIDPQAEFFDPQAELDPELDLELGAEATEPEFPTTTPDPVTIPTPSEMPKPRVQPLQKTSQIWTWIDDMLDDRFVDRLLLTLADEQSALLLLVSARMATQKSQAQPELVKFHDLARQVSATVEQAHGIGKRRDERKPPTMSQLMDIAHTVAQLLLEPYSTVLYQNNKGRLPEKLQEIKIKFGIIDEEEIATDEQLNEQNNEPPVETHTPQVLKSDEEIEIPTPNTFDRDGILEPGLPHERPTPLPPASEPIDHTTPPPNNIEQMPDVVHTRNGVPEEIALDGSVNDIAIEHDEGLVVEDDDEIVLEDDEGLVAEEEAFLEDDEGLVHEEADEPIEDDEGIVYEEEAPTPIQHIDIPTEDEFLTFEFEDELEDAFLDEAEIESDEIEIDILNDIQTIAEHDLIKNATDGIIDHVIEDDIMRAKKVAEEVNVVMDVEAVLQSGQEEKLLHAMEDQVLRNKMDEFGMFNF